MNAMAAILRGTVVIEGDLGSSRRSSGSSPGRPGEVDGADRQVGEEVAMSDELVKILDGNTFVVSDARGDIEASPTDPTGLFSFDTRFLSKWVLTVDGQRLNALSIDDLQYFETRFFLVPGTGTVYVDAKLSVIRQRVGRRRLPRAAHDPEPRRGAGRPDGPHRGRQRLRRPVRGQGRARRRRARTPRGSSDGRLVLGYERETFSARDGDLGDARRRRSTRTG